MIVVNFKTYKEATGYKAIELARICKEVEQETHVRVVAVPQLVDLKDCVATGAECWVQHIDSMPQGKTTGWVTREAVEEAGARGSLLNHSEHKVPLEELGKVLDQVRGLAFELAACAATVEEATHAAEGLPNFIMYEPPELIGSDISVSSQKPEVIEQVVKNVTVPVLIGAGVQSAEDVKVGLKLGAKGVVLSSHVVLSQNSKDVLLNLAKAFVQ